MSVPVLESPRAAAPPQPAFDPPPERDGRVRRIVLTVALCVFALAGGIGLAGWLAAQKQPPPAREPVEKTYNVEVFRVETTGLREVISAFGTARADRQVVLAAQVAGRVTDIHPGLEVGLPVSPPGIGVGPAGESVPTGGDLLLTIEPGTYRKRVELAANRLAEDDAELERLRQEQRNNERMLAKVREDVETISEEYQRQKDLDRRGVGTAAQLNRALLELRQFEDALIKIESEASLFPFKIEQLAKQQATHETDLEIARDDLAHTEVRPPFAGTLSEVLVERGQFVQPGSALVRLTDTSQVEVPCPVTLSDFARLEPLLQSGVPLEVELAENETAPARWNGFIARAAPEADELTRTIMVYIIVDNRQPSGDGSPLRPGTFVHARIAGPVLEQATVIPRDAIVNGRVYSIGPDGRSRATRVDVQRPLETLALVTSGVSAGDDLILTNLDVIDAGSRVEVQSRQTLDDLLAGHRVHVVRRLDSM